MSDFWVPRLLRDICTAVLVIPIVTEVLAVLVALLLISRIFEVDLR